MCNRSMCNRFNRWLDSLPDRTIDRVSQTLIIACFVMLAFVLGALVVTFA